MSMKRVLVVLRASSVAAAVVVVAASCASEAAAPGNSASRKASTMAGSLVEVKGIVLADPACPAMQNESQCPPRPVAAAVITVFAGTEQIEQTRSDGAGRFVTHLPSGTYRVRAQASSGLRNSSTVDITVGSAPVKVTLKVDEGIR